MDRYEQQLNRVLIFAETHGSLSDKLAAAEVRQAARSQHNAPDELRGQVAAVTSLADALADGITKDLQADNAWEQREADGKIAKAHEDYLVFRENNPDTESQAWLLRKQAEAVEEAAKNLEDSTSRLELAHWANDLYRQAEELEAAE